MSNTKHWVPEIMYEDSQEEGFASHIPFIPVPEEENMPQILYIFESRETGEFEPGPEGEDLPVTEMELHQYADMNVLKTKLDLQTYDKVRTALGLEPMQKAFVSVPNDWLGQVTREVTNRRGIIEDMPSEGEVTTVVGVLPIAETFGFSNDIRAASQGRAVWNTENLGFEPLPKMLFDKVVSSIRTRKGLKPEPNPESYYSD